MLFRTLNAAFAHAIQRFAQPNGWWDRQLRCSPRIVNAARNAGFDEMLSGQRCYSVHSMQPLRLR